MIYFVQEFDRKPEVTPARMQEIFKALQEGWEKAWPTNRLVALYYQRYNLGGDREYMAIWEMPDWAAFDEWRGFWPQVKDFMQSVEDDFHGSIIHERNRVMECLLP